MQIDVTPHDHAENAMLSPRALTGAVSHTKEAAVQCSTMEGIGNVVGDERHCRVCGGSYAADTRSQRMKWVGCSFVNDTKTVCDQWLHAKCLFGKDHPKITAKYVDSMPPYICPVHRM